MSRKKVIIRFDGPDTYENHNQKVLEIIKEDTGTDQFIMNPSYPPIYHPSPLTEDAINKLKALNGVIVHVQED